MYVSYFFTLLYMTTTRPETQQAPVQLNKTPKAQSAETVTNSSDAAQSGLEWSMHEAWLDTGMRSLWSVPDNVPPPNEVGSPERLPTSGEKLLIDGNIVEAKAVDPQTGRLAYADAKGNILFSDVPQEGTSTVSPDFLKEHGNTASPEAIKQGLVQSDRVKGDLQTALDGLKWTTGVHMEDVQQALKNTPAVMTEGEAKKVLDNINWSIAKNEVNGQKEMAQMWSEEQVRAAKYQQEIANAKTPEDRARVMTEIRETEKIADRKDAIDQAIKSVSGNDTTMKDSLTRWYEQYEKATWPARENIKNALGTKVGDDVKFSNGTTLKVTENKNGVIMATGIDPVTWGDVTHSIRYENFKWKEVADWTKLSDKFDTVFGSLELSSPATDKTEQPIPKTGAEGIPKESQPNWDEVWKNNWSSDIKNPTVAPPSDISRAMPAHSAVTPAETPEQRGSASTINGTAQVPTSPPTLSESSKYKFLREDTETESEEWWDAVKLSYYGKAFIKWNKLSYVGNFTHTPSTPWMDFEVWDDGKLTYLGYNKKMFSNEPDEVEIRKRIKEMQDNWFHVTWDGKRKV